MHHIVFLLCTLSLLSTFQFACCLWHYQGFDKFPVFFFGADADGLQNQSEIELISRFSLSGFGWQQGMGRSQLHYDETAQAQAVAQIRAVNPEIPLFIYRHSQAAFPFLELAREEQIKAKQGDAEARSLFLQGDEGKICCQGAPVCPTCQDDYAMLFNWTSPSTVRLWVDTFSQEIVDESGVNAVFFDETDWSYCGYFNTSMSNCTFTMDQLRIMQTHKYLGLAQVAKKLNAADIVPILSSFNVFSDHVLPGPPNATYGHCALPEEEMTSALVGTTWFRFYEFWACTGEPASDAMKIANAIYETTSGVPGAPVGFLARANMDVAAGPEYVEYAMAAFLVAQSEHSYFGLSTGWMDEDWLWYRQFDEYRCGHPLDKAVRTSDYTFERSFKHCDVFVDTAARVGKIYVKK